MPADSRNAPQQLSSQATTHSIKETTMKTSFIVLTAALATISFAPTSNAQGINKSTTAIAVPTPSTVDSIPAIAVPESTKIDTVKKVAGAKAKRSFLSTAPGIEMQNYRPEDKRGI